MGPGFGMLRRLGIKMAAEAITREALVRELKNTTNTTATLDGGSIGHCSLTIFSQELTVFLGYNNMQLMADLCDWFDCRDLWIYRTKGQGVDEINGVWVNLIGATTPELIQSTLPRDAIGGGLTARMIMIFEQKKGKIIPVPHLTKDEIKLGEILQSDLEHIMMLSGEFKIADDYLDLWIPWYTQQNTHPPLEDARFTGYIERRGMHVLKLSMICNASRTSDMIITAGDLQSAINLLVATEDRMQNVFSGVGRSPTSDIVTTVMRWCYSIGECTLTELMNKYYQDADRRTMEAILSTLESMKVIQVTHTPNDLKVKYIGDGHGCN